MPEHKHTSGPWRTNGIGSTGYRIATAAKDGFSIIPNIAMTEDEREANANLIAAAPELLAALEQLAIHTGGKNFMTADLDEDITINRVLAAARNAIAKAEGEK